MKNKYGCPIEYAVDKIGGRWKPWILWVLSSGKKRFGEIRREIPGINIRMLTKQLRELEKDDLVTRKVYAQVPPKVEYSLTETGESLMPILNQLCRWGYKQMGNHSNLECEE